MPIHSEDPMSPLQLAGSHTGPLRPNIIIIIITIIRLSWLWISFWALVKYYLDWQTCTSLQQGRINMYTFLREKNEKTSNRQNRIIYNICTAETRLSETTKFSKQHKHKQVYKDDWFDTILISRYKRKYRIILRETIFHHHWKYSKNIIH